MQYTDNQILAFIEDLRKYEEGKELARDIEALKNNKERAKFIATEPALKKRMDDLIHYVKFDLSKLVMDGSNWHMYMTVQKPLPQNYRAYDFCLTVDTRPLERQIEGLKHKIRMEREDRKLFEDETNKEVERLEASIKIAEKEKSEMLKNFEDINFVGYLEQVKYKASTTEMVVGFPAEVVGKINEYRFSLKEYKLDLRPIEL